MKFERDEGSLEISLCVCSIRVFTKFSGDPYYEPLAWFMIKMFYYSGIILNSFYNCSSQIIPHSRCMPTLSLKVLCSTTTVKLDMSTNLASLHKYWEFHFHLKYVYCMMM